MTDQCQTELPGSIVETAVLAIELVGSQVSRSPATLLKVIQSPAVQAKIKEALEQKLSELQKKAMTGRPVDSEQALQAVTAVFTKDGLDAAKKELKQGLEKTQEYKELMASVKSLQRNFKDRPLGIFLDEPEGVLLIVAAGMFIGGAAGMYIAATGDSDSVINAASQLAELPSVTVLGKIDLSLTDITIKPSEKNYSAGIAAKISGWKAIEKAELKIVAQKKSDKVATLPISLETKVNLAKSWSANFAGGLALNQQGIDSANFSLGIESKAHGLSVQIKADASFTSDAQKSTGSGTVKWNVTQGVAITGGAQIGFEKDLKTSNVQKSYGGNVGLSIDF
jgi:hypothetical protein